MQRFVQIFPNWDILLAFFMPCCKIIPIRKMNINDEAELGRAVRARRKKIGMTITELASVIPCSPRLLSELERGRRGVSIAATFRLLQMLGLVMDIRGSEEG